MVKRGNEHAQLRREEYEALLANGDDNDGSLSSPFQRASNETMKKRRIVRSSYKSPPQRSSPPKTNNPFSTIKLSENKPAAAPAAPSLSWNFKNETAKLPNTSSTVGTKNNNNNPSSSLGFTFGASKTNTSTTKSTNIKMSSNEGSNNKSKSNEDRIYNAIDKHLKDSYAQNPARDFSISFAQCLAYKDMFPHPSAAAAPQQQKQQDQVATAPKVSFAATPAAKSTTTTATKMPHHSTPFPSFLATAPTTNQTPKFSFGSNTFGSNAATPTPANNSFSAPAPADTGDAFPLEDPSKLEPAKEKDWKLIDSFYASYYKRTKGGEWKKYCTGTLRLQQSLETKKARMVMRDGSGKVQLNLGIFNHMEFRGQKTTNKKNKIRTTISFFAKQATEVEYFLLGVDPKVFDKALQNLKDLATGSA